MCTHRLFFKMQLQKVIQNHRKQSSWGPRGRAQMSRLRLSLEVPLARWQLGSPQRPLALPLTVALGVPGLKRVQLQHNARVLTVM